jgi:YhcH/YjgK/YiaL family protein
MNESKGYDDEKDYSLYTGAGDWVRVDESMLCILLPQDVHAPGRMVEGQPTYLKKVVIKVLV